VLYPAYLCDTLLRLAEAEAYRPLWSADILTIAGLLPLLERTGLSQFTAEVRRHVR
jgi:hypothetical protein